MYRNQVLYTPLEYHELMNSLELIGWLRIMEGMLPKTFLHLPTEHLMSITCKLSTHQWVRELSTRLMEATHGQWIYRNLVMHDRIAGFIITQDKETIMHEIAHQQELGGEGMHLQDQWMLELHHTNLEESTGERESYWLLAIKAARQRHQEAAH